MNGYRIRLIAALGGLGLFSASATATDIQVSADSDRPPLRTLPGVREAPPPPSHIEIPLESERIADFLAELERADLQARLQTLMQKFVLDAIRNRDPVSAWQGSTELRENLKKLLERKENAAGLDEELVRKLVEHVQNEDGEPRGGPFGPREQLPVDPEVWRRAVENLTPAQKVRLQQALKGELSRLSSQRGSPPRIADQERRPSSRETGNHARPRPEDDLDADGWLEQWLLRQVKNIDPSHPMFQSPAVQVMLREFTNFTKTDTWDRMPRNAPFNDLSKQLIASLRKLDLERVASTMRLPPLRQLSLPPPPRWRLPVVRLPSFGPSSPGSGGMQFSGSPAQPSRAFTTVAVVVAVAGVLWILRQRYRRAKLAGPLGASAAWTLVPPESIASKDDLIQAFEYVSLLRLGLDARSRHHRALAADLGDTEPQRSAARQLADFYEQARYAPVQEPLPEGAFLQARSALSLLSGTSHA